MLTLLGPGLNNLEKLHDVGKEEEKFVLAHQTPQESSLIFGVWKTTSG